MATRRHSGTTTIRTNATCGMNGSPAIHSSKLSHQSAIRSTPTPYRSDDTVPTACGLDVCRFWPDDGRMSADDEVVQTIPPASTGHHRSNFPPIDDYAFLSDCETSCLIARNGSVEWMCVPRPDSPSVFGAILDRSAGHFRIAPTARTCRPLGAICRVDSFSRRPGRPRPAGSSYATPGSRSLAQRRQAIEHAQAHTDRLGCRTHPSPYGQMRQRHRRTRDEL